VTEAYIDEVVYLAMASCLNITCMTWRCADAARLVNVTG